MGFIIKAKKLLKYKEENGVTEVVIPDSVTSIKDEAFKGCKGLKSITIPDSVTSIGGGAFEGCKGLTSITIPDSVTSIGYGAFHGCNSLTSITIPDSVTSIESRTFQCCKSLSSITIPDSVTSIGYKAFYCCFSLKSITIPDSITIIGNEAFYGCNAKILYYGSIKQWPYKGVRKLDFVESFIESYVSGRKFSDEVLKDNKSYIKSQKKKLLEKVAKSTAMMTYFTSEKLLDIDDVEKLENLIDSNVEINAILLDYKNKNFSSDFVDKHNNDKIEKEIGIKERTLTEWKKIYTLENDDKNGGYILKSYKDENQEIIIPDTIGKKKVTAIWEYCFSPGQYRLSENIRAIRVKITSVLIPDSVTSIGYGAFEGCSSLTSITIPDSVTSIGSSVFSGCSSLTSITIPDSVTSIEAEAFSNCSKLTSITIPDSVTYIGYDAFESTLWLKNYSKDFVIVGNGCLIKYKGKGTCISIPDSVTNIGYNAFKGCKSITSVTIPDSVTSIGCSAFEGCTSLTSVTIPNSVTSIELGTFAECKKLTSITIPDSVNSIEDWAFYRCKNLTITAKAGSYAAEYAHQHEEEIKLIET